MMKKLEVEMPIVSSCSIEQCAYNVGRACHARAITVGDADSPDCDTYFAAATHSRQRARIAGVGACKVSACRYNDDFECMAEAIEVGASSGKVRCLTYDPRGASKLA